MKYLNVLFFNVLFFFGFIALQLIIQIPIVMLIKNLSEPWFSLIYAGKKTIEIRLHKGHFGELKLNDTIEFFNDDLGLRRKFCIKVLNIEMFDTFEELLSKHLSQALPTVKTIENGVKILRKIYSQEDELKYKVAAIHVERISAVVNEDLK
ncbi:unnamed protein product [Didymodactylos carnosus]|uniref:ASCH domain-containing protein n=1 Tax=Didymodactylos carnosus TaxID=1234261 RepID=A0A814T6Y9_9BILA|nr:unnamed protein product [Didymodactylos carnosus]CAF1155455.1 unnamed protein product [Didymodactylos carnosus]CAF3738605.1 unnamed protein product [Didymodactylos carnosus]CAF3918962.1 unnamed protein product [Didymodactylos carnosus]